MSENKQFIVDESGTIRSVVLDYEVFQKMEELIMESGLQKAMDEVENEEEISLEDAKRRVQLSHAR
ncbi:MAG TPA: antitoxin [Candidatus Kapabacteria bacterium]